MGDTTDTLEQRQEVVRDNYFIDPLPLAGQETRKGESDRNSASSTGPIPRGRSTPASRSAFTRPVWRVDIFESIESPPGTLDRAHHHPRGSRSEPAGLRSTLPDPFGLEGPGREGRRDGRWLRRRGSDRCCPR